MRLLRTGTLAAALLSALLLAPASAGAQLRAGDIVVADPNAFGGNGGLIDVNPDTGAQTPISNDAISSQGLFSDPSGVAFDPQEGSLVVADPNAFGGSGGLIRVDPSTGQQTAISSNAISTQKLFSDPVGVAVAPSGMLLVADSGATGGGAVIAVDPGTGQQTLVSDNSISPSPSFVNPTGITIESSGTILVADPGTPASGGGTGAIISVDPATGLKHLVTSNDSSQTKAFSQPRGVTVETPGTLLVANASSDPNTDGVILVNRSSGQQYPLSIEGLFASPTGIAMNLDGDALVADRDAFGGGGGVIRVDPTTGAKSTVSGDPGSPDAHFVDPTGIAVVPPTCLGRYATIVGTQGADAITGTDGPDVISARGGDDIVDGEGGNDLICGDNGRDRLIGHNGNDRILGGNGADLILGGNGADVAWGRGGNDRIYGNQGNDRLYGQQGRDVIAGSKGRDLLRGGPGRDKLSGGPGHDRLNGGPGPDRLRQ